jgi:hypothetical protein
MVQTAVVADEKLTARLELAVAVSVGVVPKFWVPGLLKVIVWLPLGVTPFDDCDGALVPAVFVAVTVKV